MQLLKDISFYSSLKEPSLEAIDVASDQEHKAGRPGLSAKECSKLVDDVMAAFRAPAFNRPGKTQRDNVSTVIWDAVWDNVPVSDVKEAAADNPKVEHYDIELQDDTNVGKVTVALAKANITVDLEWHMGIYYFNFKNEATAKKAMTIVEKVIDKSKEPEWN